MNHYTLSDADMLEINKRIDNSGPSANSIACEAFLATWTAILAQEGKTLRDFNDKVRLPVTEYGIPSDQAEEIIQRMRKRALALSIDNIETVNMLLDWANVAPASYVPQAH